MADLRDRLAAQAEQAARSARAPGAAATLRRVRVRRRWLLAGRAALSLLLVLGLGNLSSRLLAEREPATPPQITAPPGPAPRQAAPLWTVKGAASPIVEPWDRGPVAAGDLVVAATGHQEPGRVRAYDPRTGELRWTYRGGANAFVRAVGDGRVVVASNYQPLVVGLDLATGEERWRLELATGQVAEYGTVAGGTLFIGASFPSEGAVDPPVVYALDLASGRQRWRTVLDRGTDLQWGAPVVDGGQVLVADTLSHEGSAPASHLHALDADTGRRRWKADLHAPQQGFFVERPVLAGGLVYLATASRMLLAVDTGSGREVWREQGGFPVLAGVRAGLVIAVIGERLVALDAASGTRRWDAVIGSGGEQWAVLDGDAVHVAAAGALVAVDAATGTIRWRAAVGPAVGPPVQAGGRIYVATRDRLVALDRRSGRAAWTSARLRIVTAPLVTSGRVVVWTRDGTLRGFAI